MLYELYNAHPTDDGWKASGGAKWDLMSNAMRPKYWTSADAAGLPIFPGLVRYGAPNPQWDDDDLHKLGKLKGSDFEVIDTGKIEK